MGLQLDPAALVSVKDAPIKGISKQLHQPSHSSFDVYCKPASSQTSVHIQGKHFTKLKLRGLSPHANYTDRAAAAGRRS